MFEMSDEQRARVHPRRGETSPLPDASVGARRVADFFATPQYNSKIRQIDFWKRGVAHAGERAAAMRAAIAIAEAPRTPASTPDVEATLMVMLDYWSRRSLVMASARGGANDRYYPVDAWFVQRWLAAGGIPFALRVLAAFPALDVDASRSGTPDTHALPIKDRDGFGWWCLEQGHLGLLHVLRRSVVVADDYSAGVDEAMRIRDTAPLFLRAGLAFVFPDEPFWKADIRDAKPKKKGARLSPEAWGLATTAVDEDHLAPILDSMARDGQPFVTETAFYGYTLVHRLGNAAARHLLAYLAVVRDTFAKEHFAEALALTDTPATREFFAGKLKDKRLGKIAKAYAAR